MKKKYIFDQSSGNNYFVVSDGANLHSIRELYLYLDDMSDETYEYHVNDNKNDFYTWIKNVFNTEELVLKIDDNPSKGDLKKILRNFISNIIHESHQKEKAKTLLANKSKSHEKLYKRAGSKQKEDNNQVHDESTGVCKIKEENLIHNASPKKKFWTLFLDLLTGFILGATTVILINIFY